MTKKANAPPEKNTSGKINTMDAVLIVVGILLTVFTARMIAVFEETGTIPDTLCTCVFTILGGECGIMGWIKTTKEKTREREWFLEDQRRKENETHE